MFYGYNQNNSGGNFEVDENVCHRLYIEADNADDAYFIAQSKGVYFDGVQGGRDCPCCGDRWYSQDRPITLDYGTFPEDKALKLAEKYGAQCRVSDRQYRSHTHEITFPNIEAYAQYLADDYGWTVPDGRIFYKDGTVKEIFKNKQNDLEE